MTNLLSALTAIAVYARICELGYGSGAAIVCGMCVGALARWAFKTIKKARRGGNLKRTRKCYIYSVAQEGRNVKWE